MERFVVRRPRAEVLEEKSKKDGKGMKQMTIGALKVREMWNISFQFPAFRLSSQL